MSCQCVRPVPIEVTEEAVQPLPLLSGEHVLFSRAFIMCDTCKEELHDRVSSSDN